VDAEVGIGVKVIVPRCHFLRAEELGDLAAAGRGRRGTDVRRRGGHMVGGGVGGGGGSGVGRHWFRHGGGLGRLGDGLGCNRVLPLLEGK